MSDGGGLSDIIGWALERWPFAVAVVLSVGFLYTGMLFGWGPDVIRPASAQTVQQQIASAKADMNQSIKDIQKQVADVAATQKVQGDQATAERIERVEQQLLWYRQQNCKSKGTARNYTWQKMTDLKAIYRKLTQTDWQMPTCADIGD